VRGGRSYPGHRERALDLLTFGDAGWGDEMARATLMTVAVSLSSMALGLVIGALGAAAKLFAVAPARWLAEGYTTVARGASVFGYGGYIEINAFTIGTVAIGIISGAYSTEVIRGAVLAVPSGQIEAASAIGMHRWLMFRRIMLPQVARFALPGLGNVWQLTLKDTALISVTGLVEIMRQAQVASGSARAPFTFYTVAALLYMLLSTFSNYGFQRAEGWAGRGVRRAS
jgi:octopine/nopaline transport system permease protein